MRYGILIAVIIYEILCIAGVGWFLKYKERHSNDSEGGFLLSNRDLPVGVVAATMALTVLGTAHILGVFEMTWGMGAAAIWFSLAHVILLVVVCLTTGIWVRRLNVTTVNEILEMSYSKTLRVIISCVMAGVIWGILTLETQGVGIVIATMTGWSIQKAAVIGGIIGILYVIIAGMKEVGWVNLINASVMYIGLVLSTVFLALRLPHGNFSSVENYFTHTISKPEMLSIFGSSEIILTFGLGTIVSVVFCQGVSQMLLQTCMAAKSEKTIKKALWIAAPVNGLFGVFAVVIGLTAQTIPKYANLGPKMAATSMLVDMLPSWLVALLLATFLAAILSTFAMTSLTPATIFTMDIYVNLFNPNATEKEITKVTRIMIIILSVIAIALAAYLPPILAAINWLFAWLVPVFFLFVFGLYWKRNNTAAISSLIVSWALNCLWSFTSLPAQLNMSHIGNAYVTLVSGLVVYVLMVNMLSSEPGYFKTEAYKQKLQSIREAS